MEIDNNTLKEILIKENYLTEEEISKALESISSTDQSLAEYLLKQEIVSKNLLGQAIAESFGVPYADLVNKEPSHEQVLEIPEKMAKKFNVVLFSEDKDSVIIATDDPKKRGLKKELKTVFKKKDVDISYAPTEEIEKVFSNYQKPLDTRFSKIIEKSSRVAPEILEEIFEDAYTFRASDIHFEPRREDVVVRFRVDGVLHDAGHLPKEYYENILNRIKVESRLRIDEHFAAQDGSMRHQKDDKTFDLRTSIVPTVEGEKVVLRVLASYIEGLALSNLGLNEKNEKLLLEAAKKPFGMILVTGPTGSGKTTTLYGVLKILNQPGVNITTIEDPVEYKVAGINQIQTNIGTDLTFAKGLRSIVRQDPDIILVGEIRDEETAEIAVNAALTGHLLLSTFHANDAATSIPRLLDMGIEPFLLSSTLELVIAQRLVRKICNACRYSVSVSKDEIKDQFKNASPYIKEHSITLYKGKGCDSCGGSGYKGRTAVFEFLEITPNVEEVILKNPSAADIRKAARKEGMMSLFEDGMQKVRNGDTTLEELLRVAPPPKNE